MLSEADVRLEIDQCLKNKGWILSGDNKNVFAEKSTAVGRADYVLKTHNREKPIIIIEAKRKGKDLHKALEQARLYAQELKSPIAYASDGSTIKTLHLSNSKPLILNGEEVDQFLNESVALQYLHTNEYNTIGKKVIQSRKELINIFASANKELRKEGLQAGIERFSEFCNVLFLKIFSEEVELAEESGNNLHTSIPKEFRWDYFKNKDGDELLSYVNNVVLNHFQKEYGNDIFTPLQVENPVILKRIIDNLDPLSLVDTNSDIKGDAFEYFLKSYLANQNKDLGEYFTPRHIVKTLVKLVNPKFGETIYDPFCGTGGILIESFKHIYNKMPRNENTIQQLKRHTIYGAEITKNAKITKMNMILTGDGHNNITRQDSLKNPSKQKHDIVVTNMPFSLGVYSEYSGLYELGSSNGNALCVEHCFNAINSKSGNPRIAMIVPEGILFDKKFTKLREFIYKNSCVKNIVSLPSGSFKPYTDVKASILYLTNVHKSRTAQQSVFHYTVKNDGYTLNTKREKKAGESDLDLFMSFNGIENRDDLLHIGFNKLDMETIKKNNYISIPNPYRKFEFNNSFKQIALGNAIEELKTRNNINAPVWCVTNDKGFIPTKERFKEQVASDNTEKYKIVLPQGFAYNPSRVNVGSIAFNDSINTGCISPMYVVFKISNKKLLNEQYLYWILQSEHFQKQIKNFAFGSIRQTVSFKDFCKIVIPVPTIDAQELISSELDSYQKIIDSAKQIIDNWKPYIKIEQFEYKKIGDYINFKQVGIVKSSEKQNKSYTYPYVKMDAIGYNGELELSNLTHVEASQEDVENYTLIRGDFLFNTRNSAELVGKCAIFEGENKKYLFNNNILRIRFNQNLIAQYVCYYLNSSTGKNILVNLVKATTNVAAIYQNELLLLSIPVPPVCVQQKIVDQLKTERKMIDSQKEIITFFQAKIDNKLNSIFTNQKNH